MTDWLTVHLCLDMQRLFAPGGIWATPWMERVLPNVVRVAEAFCPRNIFTRFIPPQYAGDMPGVWQHFYRKWHEVTRAELPLEQLDLVPTLASHATSGNIFDKPVYSAFADGRLHQWLQEKRVNALIVTGAETDICVLSTVLAAVDHGYQVTLVKDAVCSSSDTGHDALMTMYHERLSLQIQLATTDEILATLRDYNSLPN